MKQYCYDYPRPSVTVDIACFARRHGRPYVLLIQRAHPPCEGSWALPGGFVDEHEPLDRAAARELEEETGLACTTLEQFRAYGDPGRDPRGHTVTILFIATFPECVDVCGKDDAAEADWFPLDALPELAFDHHRLVPEAFDRWQSAAAG